MYAATSVFGVPYEGENRKIGVKGDISTRRSIYGSWGATENATTIQCTGNKGAVIIFNELGKFDGRDMSKIVYNLSEGTDKVRLDRQMTAYTSESYATSIISSGEISLLDRCTNKATGLQIRVFEICDKLTDTPDQSHSIKETCRENNGWAAPILAQYILDSGGIDFVLPIFKKYCQSLPSVLPQNATSARFIEKFAALIMTTADIAGDALNLPFDTNGILQYLSNHEAMTGNKRNVLADSYRIVIEACSTNKTCFFRKGKPDPSIKSYGRITTPNAMLPDGRLVIEEYEIRRSFLEEVLHKNGFTNPTACYKEWRSMGVLDFEHGKFTRGRKIDPTSEKEENVFVLRVFGTAPPAPKTPPKCKLVQNKSHKAASKIADLLDDKDEEVEEND